MFDSLPSLLSLDNNNVNNDNHSTLDNNNTNIHDNNITNSDLTDATRCSLKFCLLSTPVEDIQQSKDPPGVTTVSDPVTPTNDFGLIFVNMSVSSKPALVLIDTGCAQSIISDEFYSKFRLPIKSTKIKSLVGVGTYKVLGKSDLLTVAHGSHQVDYSFLVSALPAGINVIAGLDLLPSLGILLSGITPPSGESTVDPHASFDFVRPSLHDEPGDPDFALDPLITSLCAENSSLTGVCNLPGSTIHLDTGDSPPVFRKQYKVPFAMQALITAQIHEWFNSGVISLSPPGTQWNSPLVTAWKKDSSGNITGLRVCLDPRAINAITRNGDNF